MLYITFTNLLLTKVTGPSEAGLPRSTIFRSGRTRKLERRPELDRVHVQSLSSNPSLLRNLSIYRLSL